MRAFACLLILVALVLSVLPSASAKTADSPTGQITTPAGFLDMLKQIAACDLREIDHVAQIVGAKATITPGMIERNGHKILGWVDINLNPIPKILDGMQFRYLISIEGARYKISYFTSKNVIGTISFLSPSEVGCIDERALTNVFGPPADRSTEFHSREQQHDTSYQVAQSDGYVTRLNVMFQDAEDSCAVVMLLEQALADTRK